MGSGAWLAGLERREQQASQVLQGSRASGERKESRERKVAWASQDRKATEVKRVKLVQ